MKKSISQILAFVCTVALLMSNIPISVVAETNSNKEHTADSMAFSSELSRSDSQEKEPEIVCEMVEKRSEYSKSFRCSDGTYIAAQYMIPVHYKDKYNQWQDFDNTLTLDNADVPGDSQEYSNRKGPISVNLAKKAKRNNMFRLCSAAGSLSWGYASANKSVLELVQKPLKKGNDRFLLLDEVTQEGWYRDIFHQVDLQICVSSDGIKENLFLKGKQADKQFEMEYKTDGLQPVQVDSHTIELHNETGETIYVLRAPYMVDASDTASDAVTLTLKQVNNKKFILHMAADETWLNAPERVYPVMVDPYMQLRRTKEDIHDATVAYGQLTAAQETAFQNGWESSKLFVGKYLNMEMGALIHTDIPEIKNARIIGAYLQLHYYSNNTPNMRINAYQVTSSWVEQGNLVKSTDMPSYNPQPLDFSLTDTDSEQYTTVAYDITNAMQDWGVTGRNFGVYLRADNYNAGLVKYISSDNRGDTPTCDNNLEPGWGGHTIPVPPESGTKHSEHPAFILYYRNAEGMEDYWTYTSVGAGRSSTANINNYNGNLVVQTPLSSVDGVLMPVNMELVYNESQRGHSSSANHNTWFGYGWRLNYQMQLCATTDPALKSNYPYYLLDEDGTKHFFYEKKNGTGKYVDEDGLGYTLTIGNTADEKYTITDKSGARMVFNDKNNLAMLYTPEGNMNTMVYESGANGLRIQKIKDGNAQSYAFQYVSGSNLVASITDPAGRMTRFSYTNGYLTAITEPDGKTTTFSYAGTSAPGYCMIKIAAPNNGHVDFVQQEVHSDVLSSSNAYTAKTYSEKALRVRTMSIYKTDNTLDTQYTFDYQQNNTDVVNTVTGDKVRYQFNTSGHTTGIIDRVSGQAQYFEYGAQSNQGNGKENKLLTVSKPQAYISNRAANPRVDRDPAGTYNYFFSTANQTYSIDWDTTKGNQGKGCLKINQTAGTPGVCWANQDFTGLNGYYTASAYFNGEAITQGKGAVLYVEVINASGVIQRTAVSEAVKKFNTGWKRLSVTVLVNSGERLRLFAGYQDGTVGTIWIDDFQVEKGETLNHYNLLENSKFINDLSGWSSNTTVSRSYFEEKDGLPGGGQSVCMQGSPTEYRRVYQTIVNLDGSYGDVYSFGAWAMGFGVPSNGIVASGNKIAQFGLNINFYDGNTRVQSAFCDFNAYLSVWQPISARITANVPQYDRLEFEFVYGQNLHSVHFAKPYVYREPYGSNYSYDSNGNLINNVDLAKAQSSFAYSSDLLSRMTTPTGSRFFYSYDERTKNLLNAQTPDGQRYEFTYTYMGTPKEAYVGSERFMEELTTGEYYFRNVFSSNAMDNSTAQDGGIIKNWKWMPDNGNQKWTLISGGETDVYELYPTGNSQLRMTVDSANEGASIHLRPLNGSAAQKFKIVQVAGEEGVFRLLTKISGYTKCVDGQPMGSRNTENGSEISQSNAAGTSDGQKWYIIQQKENITSGLYMKSDVGYINSGNQIGRITDTILGDTTYTYTSSGQVKSETLSDGTKTQYTYETNSDRLKKVERGNSAVEYTYGSDNGLDQIEEIRHNNGKTKYSFLYNSAGQRILTFGGGRMLAATSYNPRGQLARLIYGNDGEVFYEYNNLGQLTHKQYLSSSRKIDYVYDADGALGITKDYLANQRTRYHYDTAGRLVRARTTKGTADDSGDTLFQKVMRYQDESNRLIEYGTGGFGAVDYTEVEYEGGLHKDRVSQIWMLNSATRKYSYDELGRRTQERMSADGKLYTTDYTWWQTGALTASKISQVKNTMPDGSRSYYYQYDSRGNISAAGTNRYAQTSYTYDAFNQLVKEVIPFEGEKHYSYDNGGNLLSKRTYDSSGVLVKTDTYEYTDASWGDLLTKYNGQAITYDKIGNPLQYRDGMSFSWANGRNLAQVTKNGAEITYSHDMDGRVIRKQVNDRVYEYVYDGSTLVAERVSYDLTEDIRIPITLQYLFDETGKRYGFRSSGMTYLYEFNGQGDVVALYNAGTKMAEYTYDAWGRVISVKSSSGQEITSPTDIANINPIRYRGYYYDVDTGLYYLQSRYYDPEVGRFLNVDSVLGGNDSLLSFNLFAYCGNNPINRIDPTGQSFIAIAGLAALVGGIIFGCTGSSSVTAAEKTPIDPSVPPPPSSGYVPPKKNPNPGKVPNPNGSGKGWPSEGGGVWVPDNKQHGGPGWTEQFPGGKHKHHYPDGHVREVSPEPINLDPLIGTGLVIAGIAASTYIIVNDITGVGVADDWLLGPAGGLITKGGILIFG